MSLVAPAWRFVAALSAIVWGTITQGATVVIRAYERDTGAPIPQLSVDDVRLFAGSKELRVTKVVRDNLALEIWFLVNSSAVVRDAVGNPTSFARDLSTRLQPGDEVHWDRVCANKGSGAVDPSTLPLRVQASFSKLAKEEPVIDCLHRFARTLPQASPGRRRHVILLADDAHSRPNSKLALARAIASLGTPVSVVHYVENRRRSKRGGSWTDIPIPPPPRAPIRTAHPPPTYPDRNSFQVFADYSGGDVVRVEPEDKYSVANAIERLRHAFLLEFQRDAAEGASNLSVALSEQGVKKYPTAVLRWPLFSNE